jgi:quinol monooxygenase YgiN
MKHFLIKYRFKDGSPEAWRDEIERFIAAVEADEILNGRIAYRCMKADNGSGEYYHLAAAADDEAAKALQACDFFKRYSEKMRQASAGTLEVLPLTIVAETSARAY